MKCASFYRLKLLVWMAAWLAIIGSARGRSLDTLELEEALIFEETKLKPPEPCASGLDFCGEDPNKYPSQELIEMYINSNDKVKQWIDETALSHGDVPFQLQGEEEEDEGLSISPACHSRREKFPSFGRSRNIKNKWKYIIQVSQLTKQSSNAEILICERPGEKCVNDMDSPDGENSTICRQVYRNQRLLAMDENGEASVDSFPLPSGCICHHLQTDIHLRNFDNLNTTHPSGVNLRMPQLPSGACKLQDDSQIRLNNGRIRRSNDRIIFPEDPSDNKVFPPLQPLDDLVARSHENLEEARPVYPEVSPCPNGEEFCELLASYPRNFIDAAINRSNASPNPAEFNLYHSPVCQDEASAGLGVSQRTGTFENGEIPLCVSVTEIIHPQKGRNVQGLWRHIVNTDLYKQGVSISKCIKNYKGQPCLYDGTQGVFPEATICLQQYSQHPFVAVSPSGEKTVELFRIPTACVCHIQDFSFL